MNLNDYLIAYLGDLVTTFSVSASALSFIVSETLVDYDVDSEEDATDLVKLHRLGIMETWKYLMMKQTANFDYSADGASFKTSQLYDMCAKQYSLAMSDCYSYLPEYEITVSSHPLHCGGHYAQY